MSVTETFDPIRGPNRIPVEKLDLDAVSRTANQMIEANRPKSKARLSLRDLNQLERNLTVLKERLATHEAVVASLRPEEKLLQADLEKKNTAIVKLQELMQKEILKDSASTAIGHLKIKIAHVESDLATVSSRIDCSQRIAEGAKKLISEFNERHGADMAELRAAQKLLDQANADVAELSRW